MKRFLTMFLVLLPLMVWGNPDDQDVDTVKVPFFNGVSLRADICGPITHLVDKGDGHYEVGARINLLDRYFPALEAGWTIYNKPFFRVGADYNILRNKHDKYKMFVGLRYGFGKFDYSHPASAPENFRHWLEISLGTDMKIAGPLHMGWDVRWRKGGFFLLYNIIFSI